jgi:transcriptional regulator with XRE-family HTH domain
MRLKAGFAKQKEFAIRSGICPTVICELESGKRFLSSLYALRIAEVLGCRLDDLFVPKNKPADK